MKMIQSFWSGGRDILSGSFGWCSPQHHLTSWALSCLQLKQFYKDVELYTDENGYHVLIEKLNLPYTKVHVVLDELNQYPSELWALGKIKAYEKQTTPFIHVDGDVFIWKEFDEKMYKGQLIVQNLEKATDYYKIKFQDVQNRLLHTHPLIDFDFYNKSACSCNAGIIGGTDFTFFKRYASEVFDFVNRNEAAGIPSYTLINFNILFEQVLFYHQAQAEGKEITPLFDAIVNDDGYKYEDIADFTTIPFQKTYLHLIGPHKRNITAADLMSRMLLKDYPDSFFSIKSLFGSSQNELTVPTTEKQSFALVDSSSALLSTIHQKLSTYPFYNPGTVALYEEQIAFITAEAEKYTGDLTKVGQAFQTIPSKDVFERDVHSVAGVHFFHQSKDQQLTTVLRTELSIKIIDTVYDWTLFRKQESQLPDIADLTQNNLVRVACIPEADDPYYREVALEELDYYILCLAEAPTAMRSIIKALEACFTSEDIENNYEDFFQLILTKMKYLMVNKCLFVIDRAS